MEYSLTQVACWWEKRKYVLILILMEYSLTKYINAFVNLETRLNPYSNGILSDLLEGKITREMWDVLILILMEYSLTL